MADSKKDRRLKGDGSVYQCESDGRWVGRYKDEFLPRPKYVYGETEAETKRKLLQLKKEILSGMSGSTKVLFKDYFEFWMFPLQKECNQSNEF